MLYFVSVYYSWSSEHPLYAFATKDEALEFMRHDYERENIQATKSDNELSCGFENKILDILTKNDLELLSGEVSVWTSENPEKTYSYCWQEI